MSLLERFKEGVKKIFGTGVSMGQQAQPAPPKKRRKWSITEIFRKKPPAPAPVPEPAPLPEPPRDYEAEALRRATEMLIEASKHPGDATWEQARNAALVYINKAQKLVGIGKTQSGNRITIAKNFLDAELSTARGVQARKDRKLDIFNSNFGFELTSDQADTVGELMQSTSFKKLMETYREKYDILIGMTGDAVEQGIDPIRIEQALDLWQTAGLEPEFSIFAKVVELPTEDFLALQEDILFYNEETVLADEYERAGDIAGIMGRYVTW